MCHFHEFPWHRQNVAREKIILPDGDRREIEPSPPMPNRAFLREEASYRNVSLSELRRVKPLFYAFSKFTSQSAQTLSSKFFNFPAYRITFMWWRTWRPRAQWLRRFWDFACEGWGEKKMMMRTWLTLTSLA
jgi:hypothetical protein